MSGHRNGMLSTPPGERILIIDDEPLVRHLAARWLASEGYHCATAEDAEEAWARLQEHDIHLVTLDMTMPGRSGMELLGDLRRSFPDTAVVMMTALADTDLAIAALTQGASDYLVKPVDRDELISKARAALDKHRRVVERRRYTRILETEVRRQMHATRRAYEETIHRLVFASMFRDDETGAHIRRVALYAETIARAAGWLPGETDMIRMAAPMHDIGKIGIPDTILRKPGRLSARESEIMQSHTLIGANMLAGSQSPMLLMAHDIALCHHERWDGYGYPNGLTGLAIPESARIVAIADVYDALTHDRMHRPAFSEDDAVAILNQGRGTRFDPVLLEFFLNALPEIRQIAADNPESPHDEMETAAAADLFPAPLSATPEPQQPETCCSG